jgi:cation transport ATPase
MAMSAAHQQQPIEEKKAEDEKKESDASSDNLVFYVSGVMCYAGCVQGNINLDVEEVCEILLPIQKAPKKEKEKKQDDSKDDKGMLNYQMTPTASGIYAISITQAAYATYLSNKGVNSDTHSWDNFKKHFLSTILTQKNSHLRYSTAPPTAKWWDKPGVNALTALVATVLIAALLHFFPVLPIGYLVAFSLTVMAGTVARYFKQLWRERQLFSMPGMVVTGTLLSSAHILEHIAFPSFAYAMGLMAFAMPLSLLFIVNFVDWFAERLLRNTFAQWAQRQREAHVIKQGMQIKLQDGKEESIENIAKDTIIVIASGETVPITGTLESKDKCKIDDSYNDGELSKTIQLNNEIEQGAVNLSDGDIAIKTSETGQDSLQRALHRFYKSNRGDISLPTDENAQFKRLAKYLFAGLFMVAAATGGLLPVMAGASVIVALKAALSVLFSVCPCALGSGDALAKVFTSMALTKHEIYVRDTGVLSRLNSVGAALFDKTGTLTALAYEKFNLDEKQSDDDSQMLRYAIALQQNAPKEMQNAYYHCFIKQKQNNTSNLIVSNLQFDKEHFQGLSGKIEGQTIALGSKRYLENLYKDKGIVIPDNAHDSNSKIYMAVNEQYVGYFSFTQQATDSAIDLVEHYKNLKVPTIMITGDASENGAIEVAKKVGISNSECVDASNKNAQYTAGTRVIYNCNPSSKESIVSTLKKELLKLDDTKTVLMVGDGGNDTLALTAVRQQGGIGVAMHPSDASTLSADIILSGDIADLIKLKKIGEHLNQIRRQNLLGLITLAATNICLAVLQISNPVFSLGVMLYSVMLLAYNASRMQSIVQQTMDPQHTSWLDKFIANHFSGFWLPLGTSLFALGAAVVTHLTTGVSLTAALLNISFSQGIMVSLFSASMLSGFVGLGLVAGILLLKLAHNYFKQPSASDHDPSSVLTGSASNTQTSAFQAC